MKRGATPLDEAYDELIKRERAEKMRESSLDRLRERHGDLAEMVVAESLSLSEALAAGKQRDDESAEQRRTSTAALVRLSVESKPLHHAEFYVEMYDREFDPAEVVTTVALRQLADFVNEVADLMEAASP